MINRLLLSSLILLVLSACSTNNATDEEPTEAVIIETPAATELVTEEATEEATESAEATQAVDSASSDDPDPEPTPYTYDLDAVIDFPMAFGGIAQISANSEWTLQDQSENESVGRIVLFLEDNYLMDVYVSNDPNNDVDSAEELLDNRNATAEIFSFEYEGLTIYYSETFLGNALGVSGMIDDRRVVFIEIRNSRQRDLDLMLNTAAQMINSVKVLSEE